MIGQPICSECRWWHIGGRRAPTCRRHPPQVLAVAAADGRAELRAAWPETAATDGCGEHQPREAQRDAA